MDFDDLSDVEDQRAEEEEAEKAEAARLAAAAAEEAAAARLAASKEAAAAAAVAAAAAPAAAVAARVPPPWRAVPPRELSMIEVNQGCKKNDPGDYYGITFPHTKDQIVEWGPEWLTKAFHLAGTMPKDNKVTAITHAKEFVGGGAGLKAILHVEYEKDDPALHKELFVKLPHKAGSDRYFVSCMWNHDRPEIIFYIWLEGMTPFRIPKFYFGDISASTTNYVLITEKIPCAEAGKKDFAPGEVEPPYDKFKDWELPAPGAAAYYRVCCSSLGKMAGFHKAGKLGDGLDAIFPMPVVTWSEVPRNLPGHDAETRKLNTLKAEQFVKFVGTSAKAIFPKDISETRWLAQWKRECLHVIEYSDEISAFSVMNPDYVALTHNNLQIDNAFFWREADGALQVGALDWGVLGCSPVAGVLQGCITGAQFEVYRDNEDEFLQLFIDGYAQHGGPQLELAVLREMSHLSLCIWTTSLIRNLGNVFKFTKEAEFATITSMEDPKVMDRFHVRAQCSQIALALQIWKSRDLYGTFKKWMRTHRLPNKMA